MEIYKKFSIISILTLLMYLITMANNNISNQAQCYNEMDNRCIYIEFVSFATFLSIYIASIKKTELYVYNIIAIYIMLVLKAVLFQQTFSYEDMDLMHYCQEFGFYFIIIQLYFNADFI